MACSVVFQVRCSDTKPGEGVFLVGSHDSIGAWDLEKALALTTSADTFPTWSSQAVKVSKGKALQYKFLIRRENNSGSPRWEAFSGNHSVTAEQGCICAVSIWGNSMVDTSLLQETPALDATNCMPRIDTIPFGGLGDVDPKSETPSICTDQVYAELVKNDPAPQPGSKADVVESAKRCFRLRLPGNLDGQPAICGAGTALGNWNPRSAPAMSRAGSANGNFNEWTFFTTPDSIERDTPFKFVVLGDDGQPRWENSRPNRTWTGDPTLYCFDAQSPRHAKQGAAELEIVWGGTETRGGDVMEVPAAVFHAFHWPFSEVQRRAAEIAGLGFDAVQLSPAQRSTEGDQWWTRYQPVRYEEIHGLGSEQDLRAACDACRKVGLQVFGDLVFNHMKVVAGCDEWRRAQHDHGHLEHLKRRLSENFGPTFNRNDFQWPWLALEGESWDGPDRMEGWGCGEWSELKGGSEKVMAVQRSHMEKLKTCGISGFRFDAAKHMRPEHIGCYVSKIGLYAYGEVLSIDPAMQAEYCRAVSLQGGGGPLPTTDFLLAVWLRRFLEAGPDAVDFDHSSWVKHLLDVEFKRGSQPPPTAGKARLGKLEVPVLGRNSVRFARNHDTVCNDVPFYGLGGWGQEGAQVAAAWLLAVHDGTALLLADDVRASPLIREALAYRRALRSQLATLPPEERHMVQTLVRARQAADGGPPLTVCIACRIAKGSAVDSGRLVGFCVLNPDTKGSAHFSGSACLAQAGKRLQAISVGDQHPSSAIEIQRDGQLEEVLALAPRQGLFFLAAR